MKVETGASGWHDRLRKARYTHVERALRVRGENPVPVSAF